MKCLEVTINGKKVCTAGVGDDGALNSLLSLVQRHNASAETADSQNNSYSESLYLTVTGIANREQGVTERLEWLNQDLDIGDELVIRIIQASACDEPTRKEVSYGGCSFCGKKQTEVAQLIAGPAVYVCNECVADCSNSIANGEPNGIVTMVIDKSAEETCSFCGQKPIEVERMVGVPAARICNQCVKICEDILEGKA